MDTALDTARPASPGGTGSSSPVDRTPRTMCAAAVSRSSAGTPDVTHAPGAAGTSSSNGRSLRIPTNRRVPSKAIAHWTAARATRTHPASTTRACRTTRWRCAGCRGGQRGREPGVSSGSGLQAGSRHPGSDRAPERAMLRTEPALPGWRSREARRATSRLVAPKTRQCRAGTSSPGRQARMRLEPRMPSTSARP